MTLTVNISENYSINESSLCLEIVNKTIIFDIKDIKYDLEAVSLEANDYQLMLISRDKLHYITISVNVLKGLDIIESNIDDVETIDKNIIKAIVVMARIQMLPYMR